ncbi:MAG: MoaD family protein [Candidatus Bathyarchaeota archaeon]|nr:MAG: MoaD family protein [Candidatus Bathyarchaeota archaeon]
MKIKVRYFTVLREITQKREEDLIVEEKMKVREILNLLSERYGDEFSNYLFEKEGLRSHIQILLDGTNILMLDGFDTELDAESTLAIVPPVGGGT